MGFNTTILIRNDAWGEILTNPKEFGNVFGDHVGR